MQPELYAQMQAIEANHWWYVGRRRILFDWIARAPHGMTGGRVLDIGCGTGFNLNQLRAQGFSRLTGVDLSSAALAFGRSKGLTLVQADGTTLPFADESFDVVLALDFLEHVRDDSAALREIARVTERGGRLILFTPAYAFLWSLQDEVSHHFRRYNATSLRAKLSTAGLRVTKLTYANTFLFPVVLAGRIVLRVTGVRGRITENDMHPSWANGLLSAIFAAEAPLLRAMNFPFGVSLLAVAIRD